MILRFRRFSEYEWTTATLEGEEAEAAANILITRLIALNWDLEEWIEEDWITIYNEEDEA